VAPTHPPQQQGIFPGRLGHPRENSDPNKASDKIISPKTTIINCSPRLIVERSHLNTKDLIALRVSLRLTFKLQVSVNRSVESCPYSFTLCRVYIENDD